MRPKIIDSIGQLLASQLYSANIRNIWQNLQPRIDTSRKLTKYNHSSFEEKHDVLKFFFCFWKINLTQNSDLINKTHFGIERMASLERNSIKKNVSPNSTIHATAN